MLTQLECPNLLVPVKSLAKGSKRLVTSCRASLGDMLSETHLSNAIVTSRVALQMTLRTLVRFCWSAYSGSWSNVLPHGMRQIPRNSTGLLGSPDDQRPKTQERSSR